VNCPRPFGVDPSVSRQPARDSVDSHGAPGNEPRNHVGQATLSKHATTHHTNGRPNASGLAPVATWLRFAGQSGGSGRHVHRAISDPMAMAEPTSVVVLAGYRRGCQATYANVGCLDNRCVLRSGVPERRTRRFRRILRRTRARRLRGQKRAVRKGLDGRGRRHQGHRIFDHPGRRALRAQQRTGLTGRQRIGSRDSQAATRAGFRCGQRA